MQQLREVSRTRTIKTDSFHPPPPRTHTKMHARTPPPPHPHTHTVFGGSFVDSVIRVWVVVGSRGTEERWLLAALTCSSLLQTVLCP